MFSRVISYGRETFEGYATPKIIIVLEVKFLKIETEV